jgi:hypothetical protein
VDLLDEGGQRRIGKGATLKTGFFDRKMKSKKPVEPKSEPKIQPHRHQTYSSIWNRPPLCHSSLRILLREVKFHHEMHEVKPFLENNF